MDNIKKKILRNKKRKQFDEYKKTQCCKHCGNNDFRVLCFHHLDLTLKDIEISKLSQDRCWEKIKKELDKCICLCLNCHAILHYKEKLGSVVTKV